MNSFHIAALVFAPLAAWYVQWLVRWGKGPFGVLDIVRQFVFGVFISSDSDGVDYHIPTRSEFSGVGLLECPRCTLFWVVLALMPVWWFAPAVVVALGIMGGASLADTLSER